MKKAINHFYFILFFLFISCNTNPPVEDVAGPLEGVWELVSGEWNMEDSTFIMPSPGISLKAMKYYSKGHFFVIGKEAPTVNNYAFAGTYSVDGKEYTEVIQFSYVGNTGSSVLIKYSVEDDLLTLKSDWYNETWKRIE